MTARTPEAIDRDIAAAQAAFDAAHERAKQSGQYLGFSTQSNHANSEGYVRSKQAWADAWEAKADLLALRLERGRLNLDSLPPVDDELLARIDAAEADHRRLKDEASAARALVWRLRADLELFTRRRREFTDAVRVLEGELAEARAEAAAVGARA